MSFASKETSRQSGAPIEMYQFTQTAAPALPSGRVILTERWTSYANAAARDAVWNVTVNTTANGNAAGTVAKSGGFGGVPISLLITPGVPLGDASGRIYITRTLDGVTPDLDPAVTYGLKAGVTLLGGSCPMFAPCSRRR